MYINLNTIWQFVTAYIVIKIIIEGYLYYKEKKKAERIDKAFAEKFGH